jgi:hypothetical protein
LLLQFLRMVLIHKLPVRATGRSRLQAVVLPWNRILLIDKLLHSPREYHLRLTLPQIYLEKLGPGIFFPHPDSDLDPNTTLIILLPIVTNTVLLLYCIYMTGRVTEGRRMRMKHVNQGHDLEMSPIYQIMIQGLLDARWSDWFDGLTITVGHGEGDAPITMLSGSLDQSALHAILARIGHMNLKLISVHGKKPGNPTACCGVLH